MTPILRGLSALHLVRCPTLPSELCHVCLGHNFFLTSTLPSSRSPFIHPFNHFQGRTTVYDDREDGTPYAVGNFVVDRPRLPIGYFELISQGTTQAVSRKYRRPPSFLWRTPLTVHFFSPPKIFRVRCGLDCTMRRCASIIPRPLALSISPPSPMAAGTTPTSTFCKSKQLAMNVTHSGAGHPCWPMRKSVNMRVPELPALFSRRHFPLLHPPQFFSATQLL